MKRIWDILVNFLLALLARTLLYFLSAPLIGLSMFMTGSVDGLIHYWRTMAITLDILGNVLGGPAWNLIFFKQRANPEVKFGSVITMSFVFAYNVDKGTLNPLGIFFCRLLEKLDPGHLQDSLKPKYLLTYYLQWNI